MPGPPIATARQVAAMHETVDDTELVASAVSGSTEAFSQLLERHYDLIYRVAFRTLGNQQDAEDVTQDICVSLAKKLRSFKGNAKFTSWLYQVTLNACRDFLRHNASRNRTHQEYREVSLLREANSRQRRKDSEWAYYAISTLPEPLRETALLVVAEGLSHAQVGEIQGVSESTISWRMHEIRKKLRVLAETEAAN